MTFALRSRLRPDDLVLCAGTVAGTGFRERVEIAARAGYRAVGMRRVDGVRARAEGMTPATMRAVLADHDLEIGELDGLTPWAPDQRAETGEALWWLAEELGSRSLNVVDMGTCHHPPEERAARFAALCERAEALGMLVQLEPLPWSDIATLADAASVVRLADRPNGGVCLDTWHLARSGQGAAELSEDITATVVGIQVNDARARPLPDLLEETLHHRLLPGEGIADVRGVLHRLRRAGVDAPIGVEVMSRDLAALGSFAAAKAAARATRDLLP